MLTITQLGFEIIEQGSMYSLTAMAMFLTTRIISFDDLTLEGSFGLGGAVAAYLAYNGSPAVITVIAGALSGALAGLTTALIARTLPINKVISGLVVTAALYSISLKIGTSFLSLAHTSTLFGDKTYFFCHPAILITGCAFGSFFMLNYFLQTEIGFMLQALGDNPQMLTNLGKSITLYTVIGLGYANFLSGLAGALFVHYLGFFSITGSLGTLVIALTSIMIAELFSSRFSIFLIVGSMIFQALLTSTIALQVDPTWNKLITTAFLITLLIIKKISSSSSYKGGV